MMSMPERTDWHSAIPGITAKRRLRAANDSSQWLETVPLADVRPTQMAVGMRAVAAKRRKIERRAASARKLRRYIEKRPVPAVLGPDEEFYIIDHHHRSLALWQSGVGEVFVRIVGDMSDLPRAEFLQAMATFGWLHPYDANGRRTSPTRLPATLDKLHADLYRDLAWSVGEAGGFAKSEIPFSEFTWANFFRRRLSSLDLARDFDRAHERAMHLARMPEARHLPGSLDAA